MMFHFHSTINENNQNSKAHTQTIGKIPQHISFIYLYTYNIFTQLGHTIIHWLTNTQIRLFLRITCYDIVYSLHRLQIALIPVSECGQREKKNRKEMKNNNNKFENLLHILFYISSIKLLDVKKCVKQMRDGKKRQVTFKDLWQENHGITHKLDVEQAQNSF